MQRVAILGLGTMGAGMAANWLAKGLELPSGTAPPPKPRRLPPKVPVSRRRRARLRRARTSSSPWWRTTPSRAPSGSAPMARSPGKERRDRRRSSALTPDWVRELAVTLTPTAAVSTMRR